MLTAKEYVLRDAIEEINDNIEKPTSEQVKRLIAKAKAFLRRK